jgi:hypothetical protein
MTATKKPYSWNQYFAKATNTTFTSVNYFGITYKALRFDNKGIVIMPEYNNIPSPFYIESEIAKTLQSEDIYFVGKNRKAKWHIPQCYIQGLAEAYPSNHEIHRLANAVSNPI